MREPGQLGWRRIIRKAYERSMSQTRPVVLVTGAGRRIGAAIARQLHAAGWRVLLHCRESRVEAQMIADQLNTDGQDSARVLTADLLRTDTLPRLAQQAHGSWRRLDALVNNASSYFAARLDQIRPEQFEDLIGSNLRAPLFLSQACVPLMSDGGSIVNILDVHARRPIAGFAPYLAAKAGLWTLTEALALELAPRIRVNAVAPGHMAWADQAQFDPEREAAELARIPLGRLGGLDEVARAVRFLLSPDAAYINGAIIPVDGGLRLR